MDRASSSFGRRFLGLLAGSVLLAACGGETTTEPIPTSPEGTWRITDAGVLEAFTYHSARGARGRKPSRRYLGLLLKGARHHGLPDEYVRWLRALPLAVDERDRQLSLW